MKHLGAAGLAACLVGCMATGALTPKATPLSAAASASAGPQVGASPRASGTSPAGASAKPSAGPARGGEVPADCTAPSGAPPAYAAPLQLHVVDDCGLQDFDKYALTADKAFTWQADRKAAPQTRTLSDDELATITAALAALDLRAIAVRCETPDPGGPTTASCHVTTTLTLRVAGQEQAHRLRSNGPAAALEKALAALAAAGPVAGSPTPPASASPTPASPSPQPS